MPVSMENKFNVPQITNFLFQHLIAIKMFHFQTTKYNFHKASDKYLEKYWANMDRLMEVILGNVEKNHVVNDKMVNIEAVKSATKMDEFRLETQLPNDETIVIVVNNYIKNLRLLLPLHSHSELANIVDDMVADAIQFIYLLLLK